jgi:hypothetical protein
MYHKAMEMYLVLFLLISLLTVFIIDASRKRREYLHSKVRA